ncbi:hypothetical protein FMUAM8_30440 [Nocardia cyriacigeorgica]|nr:hypothetical protein FMUAM8_30440 [Nocardia cyriacigeorgica]
MRTTALTVAVLLVMLGTLFGAARPSPASAVPDTSRDAPVLMVVDTSGSMGEKGNNGVGVAVVSAEFRADMA